MNTGKTEEAQNELGLDGTELEDAAQSIVDMTSCIEQDNVERMLEGPLRNSVNLLLMIWRSYYLVRMDLLSKSDGAIDAEVFQDMSAALATVAAEPFDVTTLRKDIKNTLIPFLKRMANIQFNAIAEEKAREGGADA